MVSRCAAHDLPTPRTSYRLSQGIAAVRRLGRALPIVCGIALMVFSSAQASTYLGYVGVIDQERYLGTGNFVYIQFTNGNYGTNSCNATTFWVSIDTSTTNGQASLAMALSAKLTGNQMYVAGNAVCTAPGPNNGIAEVLTTLYME
jgi:hypothetical protein